MAIQTLTQEQIKNLQKGCPVLSRINFGNILNNIIESVNAEEPCEVIIDAETKKLLNVMCPLNGIKLGDLTQKLIEATASYDKIENLSNSQIKALNQSCQTLDGCEIGNKAYEIIDVLNSREEPVENSSKKENESAKEE